MSETCSQFHCNIRCRHRSRHKFTLLNQCEKPQSHLMIFPKVTSLNYICILQWVTLQSADFPILRWLYGLLYGLVLNLSLCTYVNLLRNNINFTCSKIINGKDCRNSLYMHEVLHSKAISYANTGMLIFYCFFIIVAKTIIFRPLVKWFTETINW